MNIAIIGAGSVGRALGKGWVRAGHAVTFGVRAESLDKYAGLAAELGKSVVVKLIHEATLDAEVIVLATPWNVTQAAVESLGDVGGRVLVDCTNPLKPDLSGLTHAGEDSGGEQVARWAKNARVVKAFNTTGFNIMESPKLEGGAAVMFVAGDDGEARKIVVRLANELGFEGVEVGGLASARLLEPLAMLWISLAYPLGHGREFAFALLKHKTA